MSDDIGKNILGAVHAAGSVVLGAFGLGGLAQAVERVEAQQGWLPDWAINSAELRAQQQAQQRARDPGPGFLAGPWDLTILVPHGLPLEEARRRLDQVAATEGARYEVLAQWLAPTQARLSRSGLDGALQILPDRVAVGLRISGLLSLARGKIEARATELLRAALSGAGLPAAGSSGPTAGPPNPAAWDTLERTADPTQVRRLVRALRDLSGTGITFEEAQGIGAVPYLRAGVQVPDPEAMATEIDRYFRGLRVAFGARGVRPAAAAAPVPAPPRPGPLPDPPPVPSPAAPRRWQWLADPTLG